MSKQEENHGREGLYIAHHLQVNAVILQEVLALFNHILVELIHE
jgi:hypothetical protein